MSNSNALFLLADHIKLSLLERQRAKTLNLESDSQDGHISRSLDQFKDGVAALEKEQKRLQDAGDATKAAAIASSLPSLQKQYDDLTSQFHGFSSPSTATTLISPNDPSLAPDFAHATSTNPPSSKKTVRFSDSDADLEAGDPDAARGNLFGERYRDNPDDGTAGYRDAAEGMESNVQVHAYHQQILEEQDTQLDALGASIGRQRELSMRIGEELDDHIVLLDDSERMIDRHQGRLDRAMGQLGKIARAAGESKQMTAIIVLIIVLVLLIVATK